MTTTQLSWISNCNNYKLPRCFLPNLESVGLSVKQIKFKIDLQDGGYGGNSGFQIRTILAIFDQQFTPILLIVSSQFAFRFRRRRIDFQKAAIRSSLIFDRTVGMIDMIILPDRIKICQTEKGKNATKIKQE